jgi:hypothetical protein
MNKTEPTMKQELTAFDSTQATDGKVMLIDAYTAFQKRAVVAIGDGISARAFAKAMWPDSDSHSQSSRGGNGNQRGKKAWLMAGSHLAKLNRKGLVTYQDRSTGCYYLTQKGKTLLQSIA